MHNPDEKAHGSPIHTPADYSAALTEIGWLMAAESGTPEGDRLNVLASMVEAYEAKHYPMNLKVDGE